LNVYLLLLSFFLFGYTVCHPKEDLHRVDQKNRYIESIIKSLEPLLIEQRNQDPNFFARLDNIASWEALSEGDEGSYILKDTVNKGQFIAKPFDEAIYCLNNPKDYAFIDHASLKTAIPLYRSAQTEALCYEIATICSIENIFPTTHLALFAVPEIKLCSIQEYVPDTIPLRYFIENMLLRGHSESELEGYLDQEDFSSISLLSLLIYDNDAHASNILLYPKTVNLYGIKSIDHSLSLPEKNEGFFCFIMYLPNAKKTISSSIKKKVEEIDLKRLQQRFNAYGLSSSYSAFKQRVFILQDLVKRPNMTYYEVFIRFLLLTQKEGIHLALSDLSLEELQNHLIF